MRCFGNGVNGKGSLSGRGFVFRVRQRLEPADREFLWMFFSLKNCCFSKSLKLLFFCLLCFICQRGFCDMLYLKSGNTIEGIVEKQDETSVTLNIGSGKIIVQKKDINRIHSYTAAEQNKLNQKWSYEYFMYPDFIPDDFKDVADDFKNLENARSIAIESKKTADANKKTIEKIESDLDQFKSELAAINTKLSTMQVEGKKVQEYNSLIEKSNALVAKIRLSEYDKDMLEKEAVSLDKKISGYINELLVFRKIFMEKCNALSKAAREKNKYFLESIKRKTDEMEGDFTQYSIDYNKFGSGIMVEARLNGTVKVNLIVDTGASLVIISKQTADKLKLDFGKEESYMEVSLADGSKVRARPVVLESVKVGDLELKNIQAAVLETKSISEEDGLLGMSFLRNFLIKIDTKSSRLILEEFNP